MAAYKRLNKDKCVFLFFNYQPGLIIPIREFEPGQLRENVKSLVERANFFDIPCALSSCHESGPNRLLIGELQETIPGTHFVLRSCEINPMDDEDFVDAVRETGRGRLLSGIFVILFTDQTEGESDSRTRIFVAFPALSLVEQGYDVFVATDASGGLDKHNQETAHKRMMQHGVQLVSWASVSCELQINWHNDMPGFASLRKIRAPLPEEARGQVKEVGCAPQ